MLLRNSFEGGSDETGITAGNSGGASGDALTSLNIGAGNAFVFDSARGAHGSFSARCDLGDNPGTVNQIGWGGFTPVSEIWGSFYIFLPGAATWTGPSTLRLASFSSGGSAVGRIVLGRDARVIQISDQNFAGAATTTAGIGFEEWYRIGWHIVCSETIGFMEAAIYLGDSETPITNGTCATDSLRDTFTSCDTVVVGLAEAWTGGVYSFGLDDLNVNDEGDTGPPTFMAPGYQRVVGPLQLAAAAETLFTVPTGMKAELRSIYLSNPSASSRKVTISIGSDAAETRVVDLLDIPAGESRNLRRGINHTLEAGEALQAYADASDVIVAMINANLKEI